MDTRLVNKILKELRTILRDDVDVEKVLDFEVTLKEFDSAVEKITESKHANIKLIDGRILIIQFPGAAHELIGRLVTSMVARQNVVDDMDPFVCMRSTRMRIPGRASLEADEALRNLHVPAHLRRVDPNGVPFPRFVVEVCVSESYESMCNTAQTYLVQPGIDGVLSIKRVAGVLGNQHYAILHYREDLIAELARIGRPVNPDLPIIGALPERTPARMVISFGPQAVGATMQAIAHHTAVAPENFRGAGRGDDAPNGRGISLYSVVIPAEVMWRDVPDDSVPHIQRNGITIDLFKIAQTLEQNGFW